MKKYISYLLTLALVIPALVSCTEQLQENNPRYPKHTVYFSTSDQATKTGLTVGEEMVVFDWRKTDLKNIHLFEMDANGQTAYGETVAITPSDDNLSAHFQADFSSEDMIIHVDPATKAGGTRATERVAPYKYAAVIATKPDQQLSFVVPTVQYPDAETQKDPGAEFLIGYSRKAYDDPTSFDELVVDLYFDRVVAMSRLAISNFKGSDEKVVSVTINAENGLSGSASFADIDFENASVNFVRDEGPGILTLSYGSGVSAPAGDPFYAYFVTIPGAATVTSIEVLTDQYRYIRTIEGGKEFNFSEKTFKNINLDLEDATAEELGPAPTKYYKASSITVDGTYLIVDKDDALVFTGNTNGSSASISPVGGIITDSEGTYAAYEFVVENSGSNYYLKFNDGKYLACDYGTQYGNSSTGLRYLDSKSQVTYPYALTIDNGAFLFSTTQMTSTSSTNQVLYYKTQDNANVFKIGQSGREIGVHLYRKGTPSGKLDRTLSFNPERVTCILDGTFTKPELVGDYTTVHYSSDNAAVATVNASTGDVTIKGVGTAIITASAVEDDLYLAGSASYTLVVMDSSASTVYTKVMSSSEIKANETYVIVYENGSSSKAFKPIVNGSTFTESAANAVSASVSNGILYGDADVDACQVVLEAADGSYYFMKVGGYYLYPSQTNIGAETTPTTSRSLAITVSNGKATIKRSQYSHYLTYNSFFLRGGSDTNNLALYKLSDGSTPTPPDGGSATYTKVSTLTVGETYLIVDKDDLRLFKGTTDGSYVSVSPENNVITDTEGTFAEYEFTVENSGNNYYFKYSDGKYLVCDYSNIGNSTTGIRYVESQSAVTYPYTLEVNNGAFFFNTSRADNGSANQYIYYKPSDASGDGRDRFKIGNSGSTLGIHLYLKGGGGSSSGQQVQSLKFDQTSVTCTLNGTFTQPTLSGAKTTVTYASSNTNVASVDQNTGAVTRKKLGTTIITATAIENEQYLEGKASYTLNIVDPPSGDWVELGPFNLENKALKDYLDDAIANYTDTNDSGTDKVVVMSKYAGSAAAYSSIDRKDCPNPVTITWTNSASSSTVISLYENQSLSSPIWTQNATANSTSAEVYNLIPGRTYYYTVSEGSTIWEKGYFNTTGRRRMLKISDVEAKGHANNCRDLGGMEVTDKGVKKTIKYGYIFRGSNMDKTTTSSSDQTKVAEQTILTDFLNIGMDIDLRSGSSSSSGWNDDGNSNCYRPLPTSVSYINPGFNSFTDLTTISKVKSVITAFFTTAKSGKASYFHCYVGADRTGYIGMLLEGLLGVSEKDCSIDYELTSFSDAVGLRYRDGSPTDYYFRQGITFLRGQTGDTFQDKIENYLVNTVGISQTDIDEFKSIVLQ